MNKVRQSGSFLSLNPFVLVIVCLILLSGCNGIPITDTFVIDETAPAATSYPLTTKTPTQEPHQILDQAYYDGIVVITQYYTYLGNELHGEAFWLLSDSAQQPRSHEEFVEITGQFFNEVEILSVTPFYVEVDRQGGVVTTPDTENRMKFTVRLRAWGEGPMTGSVKSGDLQLLFITLVKEDEDWKIDKFATSP